MQFKTMTLAALLLMFLAAPAYADMEKKQGWRDHGAFRALGDYKKEWKRHAISGEVTALSGTTLTIQAKNDSVYTVQTAEASFLRGSREDVSVGDHVVIYGTIDGSVVTAAKVIDTTHWHDRLKEKRNHRTGGEVATVSGNTITLEAKGKRATTTVITNAATQFFVNGDATTSAAVQPGVKIFAFGTTTATSTAGNTFTASIVHVLTKGIGHLKQWFWF